MPKPLRAMDATIAADRIGEKCAEPEIFVGKGILELLSSALYVNPLSIFREYVQNATDAIDDAVSLGLLPSIDGGRIEVNLDHVDRRVVIRDNGTGISNDDFPARMSSIGASEKRGTNARGFRGVGRLSALGYVQQLVFRSKARGDTQVLEASWDGRALRHMLASNDVYTDLQTVVGEALTIRSLVDPEVDPGEHFFEVEMIKPRRIANDRLLNEAEIETFVGQVCPCPFSPEFSFGEEIAELLVNRESAGKSYNIHINGSDSPVFRPHRNEIEYSDTRKATLRNLKSLEIKSIDGDIGAVAWVIHHDYQGMIPASQGVRGLRARIGNMQVGHDRLFLEIFPEDRFCLWAIGEVHVLDARVVPNGRRDDFESNAHLDNIMAHLRPIGAEIARECRKLSRKRNRHKTFSHGADKVRRNHDVLKQGAVSDDFAKSLEVEIGTLLSEMEKLIDFDLFDDAERNALRRELRKLKKDGGARINKAGGNILANLPKSKRTTYKEVFDLVYNCSTNQKAAKRLIDRILDRLSRS